MNNVQIPGEITWKISDERWYDSERKGNTITVNGKWYNKRPKIYYHILYYNLKFKNWLFVNQQPEDFIVNLKAINNDITKPIAFHCMLCSQESIIRELGFVKNCKPSCYNYGSCLTIIEDQHLQLIPSTGKDIYIY